MRTHSHALLESGGGIAPRAQVLLSTRITAAKRAVNDLVWSLRKDGHEVSMKRNPLTVEVDEGSLVLTLLERRANHLDLNPSNPGTHLICSDASVSLIRKAEEIGATIYILSRMQVLGNSNWRRTLDLQFRKYGLSFKEFRSEVLSSEDAALRKESELLLLTSLLSEVLEKLERLEISIDPRRALKLIERMRDLARSGCPERVLNDLLIDILELAGCRIDERSSSPGMPDVIAFEPLWTLFELKNEKGTRSFVDQAARYPELLSDISLSGAGIRWASCLVVVEASADLSLYGRARRVAVLTWDQLALVLEDVFSKGLPLELVRSSLLSDEDPWEKLCEVRREWSRRIRLRKEVLGRVREMGGCSLTDLLADLRKREDVSYEELTSAVEEMSGPLLRLLILEGGLPDGRISYPIVSPFDRARRVLSWLEVME